MLTRPPDHAARPGVRRAVRFRDLRRLAGDAREILAALFNRPDGPHFKLDALHAPGKPPPDVAAQLKAFGSREDLVIEVAGYGSGHLSLMLA